MKRFSVIPFGTASATSPLAMPSMLLPLRTALAALTFFALAPLALAQVTFDSFDRTDFSAIGTFSGGADGIGIGVGPTAGVDGTDNTALSVGINPGAGGGFAGFVVPGPDGTTDVSATEFLTFYLRPTTVQAGNQPLTLEINLQEDTDGNGAFDGGGADDEFRAEYRIETLGDGYQFVEIPLSSFRKTNAAGNGAFDADDVLQVVFAFGGLQGPEFAIAIDNLVFTEESQIRVNDLSITFDSFDRTDFSAIGTFSGGADGIGIGVGPTAGVDGTDNTALSVGINPGAGGGFAGFVVPGPDGTTDVSSADYLVFSFRPTTVQAGNLPLTLKVNLQEDTDGNGAFDGGGADDEFRAVYRVEMLGNDYQTVAIPLSSFRKTNAAGNGAFDADDVLQVVFAFGGLQGPEFAIAIDNLGFATAEMMGTAAESLPDVFSAAPSAFPNPTASGATLAFELAAPSEVAVDVIDLLGRRVAQIASGPRSAGEVRLAVPTEGLPSGVYVVRVRTESGVATTRLTVVR